tara:strand:- start:118 stop:351 length:234 start_codon:yes stop_codon:yes gene_type:complete
MINSVGGDDGGIVTRGLTVRSELSTSPAGVGVGTISMGVGVSFEEFVETDSPSLFPQPISKMLAIAADNIFTIMTGI